MTDKTQKQENGLYIGDLEEGITEEQLFVEFRKFGAIQFVKLHRFPFIGKSKHFAFLYYSTKEEADKAREAMNYKELLRHPMRITRIADNEKEANLFFAGFNQNIPVKEVHSFFQQFGDVFSVKFSMDENKKSRGYGWVQFEKKDHADAVLEHALQNEGKLMFQDQKILIKRFTKKGTNDREDRRNNLYVKNFWDSLDNIDLENEETRKQLIQEMEEKLKEWFAAYGTIISILVKIDIERKAPYAFVSYNLNQEARRAQQELGLNQKKDHFGTGRPMYVGWAQTKVDRKQQRDTNYNAKYIYCDYLARNVTEENIRNVLKEAGFGDIQLIRLEKMQQGFQQIIRIGYLIFEQASDAHKLIKTYRENEHFDQIKNLFEIPPQDPSRQLFQYLFPQNKQNNRRNNQRQFSPNQRRFAPPFNMPIPPMGMGMPNLMPVPIPIPNMLPQRPPIPFQQQNFRRPHYQKPMPYNQQQQQRTEYVPVAYDQKQDLLDLLAKMDDFKKLEEEEQRKKLFVMLFHRMKLKYSDKSDDQCKQIISILVDAENFTVDEIMNMLQKESIFEESLKDTIEQLEEAGEENQ